TTDCERFSRRAAAEKPPQSATAAKMDSWSSVGFASIYFLDQNNPHFPCFYDGCRVPSSAFKVVANARRKSVKEQQHVVYSCRHLEPARRRLDIDTPRHQPC